ncbi:AbgT family transporter [Neobacillus cucumis]|uniref:AbgT family transporter n=1 Tax=Neobacillus cucumis TaxID=1740721 RepID=UPI0018E0509E|nr:AbgT family transporter [Neobacillus cucumis]MBI0579829.1 AbgT family transporter [Neobacillus cucumis]WHY91603.1 AbgT family transporter [Neobacillus cucumis]
MGNHAKQLKPELHEEQKPGLFSFIEKVGNKLPDPFLLFIYLIGFLMVISAILSSLHVSVVDPIKKEPVVINNLLSKEGIQWLLPNIIKNFSGFTPLGSIITLMLGIGLAEKVGLLDTIIRKMALHVSGKYASYLVVFIAICSHISSDAALVIMPPLGALIFLAVGRHPIAGLLATIAGVASGFTANFLIVTTDVLLSGISTEVSKGIDPNVSVSVLDNWFFMTASVVMLTLLAGFITDKFVEPRLGKYEGNSQVRMEQVTKQQNKALKATGIAALIFIAVVVLAVAPHGALLRDPVTDSVMPSPFISGIIPIILLFFLTVSLTYGIKVGAIKEQNDIPKLLTDPIKRLAGFIVMVFPLAQFVAMFNYSNMGKFIALGITDILENLHLSGIPVFVGLIFLSSFLCLFIASGSAIWSILAPVFIPMMMILGYHPAFSQMIFRVADSSIIAVSIVSPFVPLFLGYLKEYKSDAKLGTYYSLITPYVVSIYVVWILLVVVWYVLGLPIGPGVYPKL